MAKMTFVEYVGAYKEYKKAQGKSAKLSEAEFKGLRKEFTNLLNESKKNNSEKLAENEEENKKFNSLKEALESYGAWKKEKVGTSKITEAEFNNIKKEYLAEKAEAKNAEKPAEKMAENKAEKTTEKTTEKPKSKYLEALRDYRKFKVEEMHDNSPITDAEKKAIKEQLRADKVTEKLNEAKVLVRKAQRKLEEGDMMGAAGAVQGAGAAVNDASAMGVDPNAPATTPLPQNVVDEIQNIKTSVDALAQEAGIESPVDLGANADAGVPGAMDTTAPADPNAVNNGMMESTSAVEKRIAERAKRLEEASAVGADKGKRVPEPPIPQNSTGGNLETNQEEVKAGTTQQLLNGYASGPAASEMAPAKRWPTKPIKAVADKKLGNIEEACEEKNEDENKETLEESNSWADRHIEEYNKPKFDWNEFLASRK